MLSATRHLRGQYEEVTTYIRVQMVVGEINRFSGVAVETSEISCSLLKAVGWGSRGGTDFRLWFVINE